MTSLSQEPKPNAPHYHPIAATSQSSWTRKENNYINKVLQLGREAYNWSAQQHSQMFSSNTHTHIHSWYWYENQPSKQRLQSTTLLQFFCPVDAIRADCCWLEVKYMTIWVCYTFAMAWVQSWAMVMPCLVHICIMLGSVLRAQDRHLLGVILLF